MRQEVMRSTELEPESKAIYAYLASFAGVDGRCYPTRKGMLKELKMSEARFSRYMRPLVDMGIVVIERERAGKNGGRFGRNIYTITHEIHVNGKVSFYNANWKADWTEENVDADTQRSENWSVENWSAKNLSSNNNSINNNRINNNREKEIVCPEPEKQAPDQSGILLPLADGSDYDVPLSKIEKWTAAYPAVDVQQELRKMIAWLDSNPQRKKTRRGIDRFINSWLSKEQDRGGKYRNGQQTPVEPVREFRDDVERYSKYLGNRPPSPDDPFQ